MKQKYYLVEWPESQSFMDNKKCIQSEGMSYFVPCEIYETKK
jgi:hypothetical protein